MHNKTPDAGAGTATPPDIAELIELARQGREDVLPELRAYLDDHPEIWQQWGNLAQQAQNAWLDRITGPDVYAREQAERFTADLRQRLAGTEATELEKLQIERIVALHLQLGFYEVLLARNEHKGSDMEAEFLHGRYDVANRRLQEAMLGLANLRKMLPRTLRVALAVSGTVKAKVRSKKGKRKKRSANRLRGVLGSRN